MSLKQVAAAGALAFVSSSGLAAYGESAVKGVRAAAHSGVTANTQVARTGLVLVGWGAVDPVAVGTPALALPADARQVAADSRIPSGGRSVQGAGMVAAAATAQSFTRMAGSRPNGQDSVAAAEPSAATENETDTGALILAGLGVAGLLALRRNVGG